MTRINRNLINVRSPQVIYCMHGPFCLHSNDQCLLVRTYKPNNTKSVCEGYESLILASYSQLVKLFSTFSFHCQVLYEVYKSGIYNTLASRQGH